MFNKPVIEKTLVISTGHIKPRDLKNFKRYGGAYFNHSGGYGMMLYTGGGGFEEAVTDWDKFSPEFRAIMEWASKNDIVYVNFDCAGEVYEELPVFDW
jgi:hypothetical protein